MYRKQTAQETGLTQMSLQDVANSYFPYWCDYILLPQSPWESILDPPQTQNMFNGRSEKTYEHLLPFIQTNKTKQNLHKHLLQSITALLLTLQ